MAKLIVALSLLVGGANAMGIYGTGRPTAEPTGAPTAVSLRPFASEGLDASLARRSTLERLRPRSR